MRLHVTLNVANPLPVAQIYCAGLSALSAVAAAEDPCGVGALLGESVAGVTRWALRQIAVDGDWLSGVTVEIGDRALAVARSTCCSEQQGPCSCAE